MSYPRQASEAFIAPPEPELVCKAKASRRAQDWRSAALLFTAAADEQPADPHGNITATEIGLRRDAHLCLNRTAEFQKHRERWKSNLFPHEWREPSGELVHHLLGLHVALPRGHHRSAQGACS